MSNELAKGLHEMRDRMKDGKPIWFPGARILFFKVGDEFPEDLPAKMEHAFLDAIAHGFVIGAKVTRLISTEVGEVLGLNTTDGIYHGERYPIVVKFESGIFEYAVSDLELKEVPEDCPLVPYCVHQIQEGSDDIRVQDDISGDRERAYTLPFKHYGQFDHGGPVPVEVGKRWYGYIWAEDREQSVEIAKEIIGI